MRSRAWVYALVLPALTTGLLSLVSVQVHRLAGSDHRAVVVDFNLNEGLP